MISLLPAKAPPGSEGWAWPLRAGKPHFFDQYGHSLCGHWHYYGPVDDGRAIAEQDCKTCVRKAAKRTATQEAPEELLH